MLESVTASYCMDRTGRLKTTSSSVTGQPMKAHAMFDSGGLSNSFNGSFEYGKSHDYGHTLDSLGRTLALGDSYDAGTHAYDTAAPLSARAPYSRSKMSRDSGMFNEYVFLVHVHVHYVRTCFLCCRRFAAKQFDTFIDCK